MAEHLYSLGEFAIDKEILMRRAKQIVKSIVPRPILQAIRQFKMMHAEPRYKHLATEQVFSTIYEEGVWGTSDDSSQRFYSGDGSHNKTIVDPYINSVRAFLSTFEPKPNVVDLGCGDFYVGERVRDMCEEYIACDIVPQLISFNRDKYRSLNVDFRVLDLTKDELPSADIAFLRQVLQHLSNAKIAGALQQISLKYKYLVLTEHLPSVGAFVPNLDMPTGATTRLYATSGLILTCQPFNLKVKGEQQLCVAPGFPGELRTTLYELA